MRTKIVLILQLAAVLLLIGLVADNLGLTQVARSQRPPPIDESIRERIITNSFVFTPDYAQASDQSILHAALEQWEQRGLLIATSPEDLYAKTQDKALGNVIFLNQAGLDALDQQWISSKYREGVAVVGIGIALSDLGIELGIEPTLSDLDLNYARGRVQVSLCHEFSDQRGRGSVFYTDFWNDLSELPQVIANMIAPSLE